MRISVGIDIAKEVHWATAIDPDGVVRIDRKLLNAPTDIAALIDELATLGGQARVGLDVVGGIAGLAQAMLAGATMASSHGFALLHVPGLAVNRARQGTAGGENKSDPRDARTIAEQVRTRVDLRPIEPVSELDLEIRLLAGRRRDLVQAQTQQLARLHDLLVGIFPGLERALDLTTKGALHLLAKFVTPAELRSAGRKRLVRHLQAAGGLPKVEELADRALAAAPVLRQSGKTRFLRRPVGGNKGLKRCIAGGAALYQSAFCSLGHHDSRAFYDRKRREGKRHHQAVIALARRRVNVLWAIIQSRSPFQAGFKTAT